MNPNNKMENIEVSSKKTVVPEWRPFSSILSVIALTVFGLLFLALGIPMYNLSNQIKEVEIENYDDYLCRRYQCTIQFIVPEKIPAPIYVFYRLDNYYQSFRKYVKSRSFEQLQGKYLFPDQLTDCEPIIKNKDLAPFVGSFANGRDFNIYDLEKAATPCGVIARSLFTDEYALYTMDNARIPIDEKGIAWQSDIDNKFKNVPDTIVEGGVMKNWTEIQWIDMTNEHFIVWMRTAGLPNPRKIYGKINQDLEPGQYKVVINNNYDKSHFDGNKTFILSTTNALGGKNFFLAVCYIVVGSICGIFALISLFSFIKKKPNIRFD